MKLLVATGNAGKLKEYREMLDELVVEWVSLRDVGLAEMEVPETGATFAENALIKARAYQQAAGLLTLADDSGLEVDALGGAPGVYSARYGAPQLTTDQERYEKLLLELKGVPEEQRTARFVCVVAIAAPHQEIITVEGSFEGHVAYAPRGSNGFGYDPIFITPSGRTYAELDAAEKHSISHRGKALRIALPIIRNVIKKTDV